MGEDKKKPQPKTTAANEIRTLIKNAGQTKDKITHLDITGVHISKFTPEIKKILEELTSLETLIAAQCDLTSLDNLPNCPLVDLDVSSNSIKDQDLKSLAIYPKLTKLNIADNKINKLDSIKLLKGFKKLQNLQTADNPIQGEPNYFRFIFDNIKSLEILDNKDKNGQEVEMEEEEYDEEEDDENLDGQDEEMGEEGQQGQQGGQFEGEDDDDDDQFDDQEEEEQEEEQSEELPKKRR